MIKSSGFVALLVASLALLTLPTIALAHGEPEITVSPDTVAAGGKITIKGEKMGANEEFKVSIQGLKSTAELGDAQSNADETFDVEFAIPADLPEGSYQVKVVGADGDAVAAEVTVTAASKTGGAEDGTDKTNDDAMPSAAEHELTRGRTPGEVGGLFALAAVSAIGGLLLVVRR